MKNNKATWQGGSTNLNDFFSGKSKGFNVSDSCTKTLEKQVLSSGAVERLAEDLTEHLKQHKTIKIRTSCKRCKKPFARQKLVTELMLCQKCLIDAQNATVPQRNRILAEVIRNYTVTFQRRICMGGRI